MTVAVGETSIPNSVSQWQRSDGSGMGGDAVLLETDGKSHRPCLALCATLYQCTIVCECSTLFQFASGYNKFAALKQFHPYNQKLLIQLVFLKHFLILR